MRQLNACDAEDKIERKNISLCLRAMGMNPIEQTVDEEMEKMGLEAGGVATMEEFFHIYRVLAGMKSDETEMLRAAFEYLDRDGSGSITLAELTGIMTTVGDTLSEVECQQLMKIVDRNGDGILDFKEFLTTVQSDF